MFNRKRTVNSSTISGHSFKFKHKGSTNFDNYYSKILSELKLIRLDRHALLRSGVNTFFNKRENNYVPLNIALASAV